MDPSLVFVGPQVFCDNFADEIDVFGQSHVAPGDCLLNGHKVRKN
jgi:hypothetical protein